MDWTTWKPASCLPLCWCETARVGSWILEPVNTWTNLGFIFFGIFFLMKAKEFTNQSNTLNTHLFLPKLYGFALIFVGVGSFFYHASQTFIGQWFDVFGMYLVAIFYICYNWLRTNKITKAKFIPLYFAICIGLGIIIWYFPLIRRQLFGVAIAYALIQSILIQKKNTNLINPKYMYGSVACYAIAQGVWLLDKNRIWCDPHGWINGHGIWHLLCAVAAYLIYKYFQSEQGQAPGNKVVA